MVSFNKVCVHPRLAQVPVSDAFDTGQLFEGDEEMYSAGRGQNHMMQMYMTKTIISDAGVSILPVRE